MRAVAVVVRPRRAKRELARGADHDKRRSLVHGIDTGYCALASCPLLVPLYPLRALSPYPKLDPDLSHGSESGMTRPRGAYGLRVNGICGTLLLDVPPELEWAGVTLSREITNVSNPRSPTIGPEVADVPLLDGDHAVLRRSARSARLLTAATDDDGRLVHPFLTTVAVIFAWWDGRHAFHGGAFTDSEGCAWCVLGDRESGKSSTLARLSLAGVGVLSDDLIVVRHGRVLAGPRCIDLRRNAAVALGADATTVSVRGGERLRLTSTPVPPELHCAAGYSLRGAASCASAVNAGRMASTTGWSSNDHHGPLPAPLGPRGSGGLGAQSPPGMGLTRAGS